MDILDWPNEVCPANEDWLLLSNSKTFISPFTGSTQTARFPGSRWRCDLTFNNLTEVKNRKLEALVAALDGVSGRVKISTWARKGRAGYGEPMISGGGQLGTSLQTKGWKRNMRVLAVGDYITVGNELKLITVDVVSDINGNARLAFSPMLRSPPNDGDHLEVIRPYGVFRLLDNEQGKFQRRRLGFANVTLSFEEVLS